MAIVVKGPKANPNDVRFEGELHRLAVQSGDVLVVKVREHMPEVQLRLLEQSMERTLSRQRLGSVTILIMIDDVDLTAIPESEMLRYGWMKAK